MDVSAQEVRQLDDRLRDWEQKNLFQLESVRPTDLRSSVDFELMHADRFRQSMLCCETGRAWGIFMSVLRFHYSTLEEAIDELCDGMDVITAKQDLQKKSSLFRMVGSVFQDAEAVQSDHSIQPESELVPEAVSTNGFVSLPPDDDEEEF